MGGIQRLMNYIAASFVSCMILQTTGALGSPLQPRSEVAMYYKGVHTDNSTGKAFDLFVLDDSVIPDTAFDHYMSVYNHSDISKRDWFDCRNLGTIQTAACNTGHALTPFLRDVGVQTFSNILTGVLTKAFTGGRDTQAPRSICLNYDGNNVCVSWASYDSAGLQSGQSGAIAAVSADCAARGGSAEFKTIMTDGKPLSICVSNRATGCGQNVC